MIQTQHFVLKQGNRRHVREGSRWQRYEALKAQKALKLATCDGPPYYYKVAYEEAERMLKALG